MTQLKTKVRDLAPAAREYGTEAIKRLGRPPVRSFDARWSVVSSLHDQKPQPSRRLIELALDAARLAMDVDVSGIAARAIPEERVWVESWPGEHYRLLLALTRLLDAEKIIEVGTFTGMGALSLLEGQSPSGKVITYDIFPWDSFENTLLRSSDPWNRIDQRLGDLADPSFFATQKQDFLDADFIFVDGPKDGVFEPKFVKLLVEQLAGTGKIVMFDDIRTMPMLQLWRDLDVAKLDVTSFGHWSGTGLIEL